MPRRRNLTSRTDLLILGVGQHAQFFSGLGNGARQSFCAARAMMITRQELSRQIRSLVERLARRTLCMDTWGPHGATLDVESLFAYTLEALLLLLRSVVCHSAMRRDSTQKPRLRKERDTPGEPKVSP